MRINLYGGPGAGKSTTAAWLFSELKRRNISIEHVSEYVKGWAYQKRKINKYDQLYLFGKQHQMEYKFLSNGVKNIVTDSPCLLSAIYAEVNGCRELSIHLGEICKIYEADFPSLNIFMDRGNKPYDSTGRWQTKEESIELDRKIKEFVTEYTNGALITVPYHDERAVLDLVLDKVKTAKRQS